MAKYRAALPQLDGGVFVTDAGLETVLIFHEGLDLPEFAAFTLLETEAGQSILRRYFTEYAALAKSYGVGCVLESMTWRANASWGAKLGYDVAGLDERNRQSIQLLVAVRSDYETDMNPMPISGNIGSSCDGYSPTNLMDVEEARAYHGVQIASFKDTEADFVSAFTMAYVEEALGIVLAARDAAMPVVISFTVETDGNLPSGQPLGEAIQRIDDETGGYPAYYMINCAHPTHFDFVLEDAGDWVKRIHGLRANASCMSHEELDNAEALDDGNPEELGQQYARLRSLLPKLNVLGGCCGTDKRHVEAMIGAF